MSLGLFKSKLHLAVSNDDLRPALQHIAFIKGYVYVTDALIAIRQSLAWMDFSPEEIAIMNGKFLTAEAYELALKASAIEVTEDGLDVRLATKKRQRIFISWAELSERYPDVESVFRKSVDESNVPTEPRYTTQVGLHPKTLSRLLNSMDFEETAIFDIRKPNDAVVVTATAIETENQLAIIMPTLLNP